MARLIALGTIFAVCIALVSGECSKICPAILAPVCGVNTNGEYKTFSNLCLFNSAKCENPSAGWYMTRDGECEATNRCDLICNTDYSPVCGLNKNGEQITFGNLCMFNAAKCRDSSAGWYMTRDGECEVTNRCDLMCTEEYSPVCGLNKNGEHITFGNLCMFNAAKCRNPSAGWFMTRDGECEIVNRCGLMCTAEYNPICALNKNGEYTTFGNMCMFNTAKCRDSSAGWYMSKSGECTARCNQICTQEYNPVCGLDRNGEYKTYPNQCIFNFSKCNNPNSGLRMVQTGECN